MGVRLPVGAVVKTAAKGVDAAGTPTVVPQYGMAGVIREGLDERKARKDAAARTGVEPVTMQLGGDKPAQPPESHDILKSIKSLFAKLTGS